MYDEAQIYDGEVQLGFVPRFHTRERGFQVGRLTVPQPRGVPADFRSGEERIAAWLSSYLIKNVPPPKKSAMKRAVAEVRRLEDKTDW